MNADRHPAPLTRALPAGPAVLLSALLLAGAAALPARAAGSDHGAPAAAAAPATARAPAAPAAAHAPAAPAAAHAPAAPAAVPAAPAAPAAPTAHGTPAAAKAAPATAPAAAGKPGVAAAAAADPTNAGEPPALAPADALEHIRKRLAERLGAAKPVESSPGTLKLVARPPAEMASRRSVAARSGGSGASGAHGAAGAAGAPGARADAHGGAKAAAGHAAHWDYQGEGGPARWADLRPEFAKCANGNRQSPIDIRDGLRLQLEPVQFDYRPSSFRVIDNGHTVQVNVAPGNSIEVTGRRYDLVQFHFHRPSEERINGRQFDMVAHLVHKDPDGRLAVVAVLLDRGSVQPLVQTIWNNLPLEKGEEVPARVAIDLNSLLPVDRAYYTYMGSLTTPPCSEGVLWMVMKNPVPVSAEQINIFSRLYPMNARPLQQASGRLIKESN